MAKVPYQQCMQVGGSKIQIDRLENMCEDWTWRTVKLVGFFIGAIAVFSWIFQLGGFFERYNRPPAAGTATTRVTRTAPAAPPPAPTVIKVEVVSPPPPAPPTGGSPPAKKSGLPSRAW